MRDCADSRGLPGVTRGWIGGFRSDIENFHEYHKKELTFELEAIIFSHHAVNRRT